MSSEGTPFQPGAEPVTVSFRPRGGYAGYRAFGGGDDAVLVEPDVARELRHAAEYATAERRITGGLLFGRGWVDEQGAYLVVNGFLEAGPGENSGDRLFADGTDDFMLSEADLRLLREDAARMYSARLELGWWRTRATLGEFGPQDFATQAELVGPDGVGLLVYGSGIHWGTAYLGPDGHAPDSAGTLVAVPTAPAAPAVPEPGPARGPAPGMAAHPEPGLGRPAHPEPGPPHLVDIAAGESMRPDSGPAAANLAPPDVLTPAALPHETDVLSPEALPPGTPVPRRSRPRMPSRVRQARAQQARDPAWTAPLQGAPGSEPEMPADIAFVVGALALVVVVAAIIVGVLAHSMTVAIIIAVVGVVVILAAAWLSRHPLV